MDNALHALVSSLVTSSCLLSLSTAPEASDHRETIRRAWKALEFLAAHPSVDLNTPSSSGEHVVLTVSRFASIGAHDGSQQSFIIDLLKLLVQHGADIPASNGNHGLVETMAEYGYMEVVSWLALDLVVDIQHLVPGSSFGTHYNAWQQNPHLRQAFLAVQSAQKQQIQQDRQASAKCAPRRRNRRG